MKKADQPEEQLNELEQALLAWIAEQTDDVALSGQIHSATLKRRDYMRTGFFVFLNSRSDCAVVAGDVRPVCPLILNDELYDGAGCNLFLKGGRLHYLEIYARGGFLPEQLRQFSLTPDR